MICWINPFTGLAGDMLLAALIDVGAPLARVRAAVESTGLTGWELTAERVVDHGLAATRVHVRVEDRQTRRRADELIAVASLATPAPVAALAVAALTAIAEVEGALHGVPAKDVHLHELGGHDTIVDIVGTAAALHALGITQVHCAPLPLGIGRVDCAHGVIPSPAPATLALLRGAAVTGTDQPGESVTPTAAALLKAAGTRYGGPPAMALGPIGYGAGTRQLADRPNVASVSLGTVAEALDGAEESVVMLETNLDDVTGETLAHTIARAIAAGALDAWATPAVMKKGRPAYVLHVLADPRSALGLQRLVFAETGSLGMRRIVTTRTVLPRQVETVHLDGVPIRVKRGPHGSKPEHDDLADAAARLGLPLRTVAERVRLLCARPVEPVLPALTEENHDH